MYQMESLGQTFPDTQGALPFEAYDITIFLKASRTLKKAACCEKPIYLKVIYSFISAGRIQLSQSAADDAHCHQSPNDRSLT